MRRLRAMTLGGVVLTACSAVDVGRSGRPCGSHGECVAGYACHPETEQCVPVPRIACDGAGVCPAQVETGSACDASLEGAFLGCADDPYHCIGGCRTCENGLWGPCVGCYPSHDGRERCDGVDNDCDGETDGEGSAGCLPRYSDLDDDGYGVGDSRCLCGPEADFRALVAGDCDDSPAAPACGSRCRPGGTEVCDDLDNDCDGLADDGLCQPGTRCLGAACVPCTSSDPLGCGPSCQRCTGATPACVDSECRCEGQSCGAGSFCDVGTCTPCANDDPDHCGPSCTDCSGTTPGCAAGACVCAVDSCPEGQGCLPTGVCAVASADSTLTAVPARVPADGLAEVTLTVTLIDDGTDQPLGGHLVWLHSSRAEDLISPPAPTDASGTTTAVLRSTRSGLAVIAAGDRTAARPVRARATVAFLPVDALVLHLPLDVPDGAPLSPTDLDGVPPSSRAGLWHLEEAGGGSLADDGGTLAIPIADPEEFAGTLEASAFTGLGFAAPTQDAEYPIDIATAAGIARVVDDDGTAELQVSSAINTQGGEWNYAGLAYRHLAALAGDYDLQADYSVEEGATATAQIHIPFRLIVVFAANVYTLVDYHTQAGGRTVLGQIARADTSVVNNTVALPPVSGAFRITRTGASHGMYYWNGSDWAEILTAGNHATGTPVSVLLIAYAQRNQVTSIRTRVDNFVVNSAPQRTPAGKLGRALRFDGNDLAAARGLSVALPDALTLSTWMRAAAPPVAETPVVELGASATESHALLLQASGQARAVLDCQSPEGRFVSLGPSAAVTDGRWHHLAVTYGAGTAALYVDGLVAASATALDCADLDDGATLALGGAVASAASRFIGWLDEPLVLRTAATATQVAAHHRRGRVLDPEAGPAGEVDGPVAAPGLLSGALSFDGIDDQIATTLPAASLVEGDFTVSLFCRTAETAQPSRAPHLLDTLGAGVTGLTLLLDGSRGLAASALVAAGGPPLALEAPAALNDDAWHHLALRRAGDMWCLWVDGTAAACDFGPTASLAGLSAPVFGRRLDGSQPFLGRIDEVRWHDRALTDEELRAEASRP